MIIRNDVNAAKPRSWLVTYLKKD